MRTGFRSGIAACCRASLAGAAGNQFFQRSMLNLIKAAVRLAANMLRKKFPHDRRARRSRLRLTGMFHGMLAVAGRGRGMGVAAALFAAGVAAIVAASGGLGLAGELPEGRIGPGEQLPWSSYAT